MANVQESGKAKFLVIGKTEEIKKAAASIMKWTQKEPKKSDFGKGWLGNLFKGAKIDVSGAALNGEIDEIDKNGITITDLGDNMSQLTFVINYINADFEPDLIAKVFDAFIENITADCFFYKASFSTGVVENDPKNLIGDIDKEESTEE